MPELEIVPWSRSAMIQMTDAQRSPWLKTAHAVRSSSRGNAEPQSGADTRPVAQQQPLWLVTALTQEQ